MQQSDGPAPKNKQWHEWYEHLNKRAKRPLKQKLSKKIFQPHMQHLVEIQEWLGAMIAQPLQENHLLPAISPFGKDTEKEATHYIAPSAKLTPHQRVQIYHQQYWWRLLKSLQNNFPLLTRLFGYHPFQKKLAIPYLTAHPPQHWALCKLGSTFPQWLHENYSEDDRYLVLTSAHIDWAATEAFWIYTLPFVDFSLLKSEETLSKKLVIQPHINLFKVNADFFTFREEFLKKEPEYYDTHPFPHMNYGEYHFVLYRTPKNVVTWREISQAEYWMLSQFKNGNTIEMVCALIEEQGGEILEEALAQIPFWFKQWTVLQWFGSLSSL